MRNSGLASARLLLRFLGGGRDVEQVVSPGDPPGSVEQPGLVRDARVDDAAAIAEIYGPVVTRSTISFELQAPSSEEMAKRISEVQRTDPWLVLEIEGHVVGFAYATPFRSRPAYSQTRETTVYVSEQHRRSGVARRLMTELLRQLAEGGIHVAVAGITLPNDGSVALHENTGFRHVGTFHGVGYKFGRRLDVGFWELQLTD